MTMNSDKIKAFIINYNRVTLPSKMADYLVECDITPIFIDNNSNYPPLIEYYKNCNYRVIRMDKNYGHSVIWDNNILEKMNINDEFIITDPDLEISEIPKDFLNVLRSGLDKYPYYKKCGFSLRTSDIPNTKQKEFILRSENVFWRKPIDDQFFIADIDTTFALYRTKKKTLTALRTNEPYSAKHIPWYYEDINKLPEDEYYYFNTIQTYTYYSHRL